MRRQPRIEEYKILYRNENISMFERSGFPHARQPRAVKESTDVSRKQPRANKYAETMQPFSSSRRGVGDNDIALALSRVRRLFASCPAKPSNRKHKHILYCSENESSRVGHKHAEATQTFSNSPHRPVEQWQRCCIGRATAPLPLGLTFDQHKLVQK